MKTLILDDEPLVVKLLAHALARHGIEDAVGCGRARDALERLAREPGVFGLAFVDLHLPEVDGVEFLRHLSRIGFRGAVVLMSGTDGRVLETAVKLARSHGLDVLGALRKPVAPDALAGLLAQRRPPRAGGRRAPARTYGPEALRRAIDTGQLVNHYQPKVELAGGGVVGVESLVRWRHPDDGWVFPDQFVPAAEEHGLIDALTRAVLGRALEQGARWAAGGLALHVAVNVSMDNLSSLALPELVTREAARWGFPPAGLVLEVTESRLMQDARAPLDVLARLKLRGLGLSIDDFGTGYSSLVQLRDFPFDELKVDRGFVHGAWREPALRSIFEASRGLASELGLRVVAEGVEDADDWRFVRATGCDLAQGYFIARPMPAGELPRWIRSWERRRPELVSAPPPSRLRWIPSAS